MRFAGEGDFSGVYIKSKLRLDSIVCIGVSEDPSRVEVLEV